MSLQPLLAEVVISEYDEAVLEDVVRLWEDGRRRDAFSLAEVLAALQDGQPAVVARAGDEVIGAVAARVAGRRAWILRWSVAERWRGHGIGRRLLASLERRFDALGVQQISMLVDDEAIASAEAAGYTPFDTLAYVEKRDAGPANGDGVDALGGVRVSEDAWLAIGGMEREKELIERRIVLPLAEQDEARRHGVKPASAVVLFGPPGTGKTTFAKAIAGRLGWTFIEIFPSHLAGADAHGRAGALRDLFDELLHRERVVVFIDEVEDIASSRRARPETHVIANELLKVIPRFRSGESRLLVCATNAVHDLDHAFTRPGRFDYLLPIGPPDLSARRGIWARYVGGITAADVDLGRLAERSQYFSPADIEFAARKAAQAAFERSLLGGFAPAETRDFLDAIAEVRPSITAAMSQEFEEDIVRFARS